MRTEPALNTDTIKHCLAVDYGFDVGALHWLGTGYDMDAFGYEAVEPKGCSWFVRFSRGPVNPGSVNVPLLLASSGVSNILAPVPTRAGDLWSNVDEGTVVVFPFIRGNDGTTGLTDEQWLVFGQTLAAVHNGGFEHTLSAGLPTDSFSSDSIQPVLNVLNRIDEGACERRADGIAEFLHAKRALLRAIVHRMHELGDQLKAKPFERVLCHGDIHAANILVSDAGELYLTDWDTARIAPRERDLIFIIGSRIARKVEPREESIFLKGYGSVYPDPEALSYYRYERILEDVGEIGTRRLLTDEVLPETENLDLDLLQRLFSPGDIVETTLESDSARDGMERNKLGTELHRTKDQMRRLRRHHPGGSGGRSRC